MAHNNLIENTLFLARTYSAHTGLSLGTISKYAARRGGYLEGLADQTHRKMTDERYAEILAWFDEHWPNDLTWPRQIKRPRQAEGCSNG